MNRVKTVFEEYQNRQCGLIKALNSDLDILLKECKKIRRDTPYVERKCLWGLNDQTWKLEYAAYAKFGVPPQPEPLPTFEEGMSLREWVTTVADYSYAWLVSMLGYLSMSFTLEERRELLNKIQDLPLMKDVVTAEVECAGGNPPHVDCVIVDEGNPARKTLVEEGGRNIEENIGKRI